MAKLHLPGDWAPTLVFALAGVPLYLIPPEPGAEVIAGKATLGLIFLGLAVLLGIAAFRGREIEDSAVYYYWKSLETSFAAVAFSALLVFFGSGFLLIGVQELSIYELFFGTGFLIFAYYFCLHARITVFNKNKTFFTMVGKPWSFTRRYKASDFDELAVSQNFSYAGQLGMIQYWQRHFFIFAVKGKKGVLLLRENSLQDAEASLKKLSGYTGLPIAKQKIEEGEPLAPDLRVEIGGKKITLQEILAKSPHPIDTLTQLQEKYPKARVLKALPENFPRIRKKKREFTGDHFVALLRAAKIPHYLHTSTPDQTDIWYFQRPLILPLKLLKPFEDFDVYTEAYPQHFIAFTDYDFSQEWEAFYYEPDRKYPPHDADEETQLWWGRQGKDKL